MNTKRKTLWIAIVGAGLATAGVARAQDEYGFEDESAAKPKPIYENYIEIGGGYTDDGNGKFGEYTTGVTDAFQEQGGFPVGSLRLSGGDESVARSWDISAGVGNGRSLEASYGVQGNFGVSLYGDRVEKTEYGEAGTVYGDASGTMLLPPDYAYFPVPAPSAPAIPPPPSSYDPAFYSTEDIRSERQILGLEGFKNIGDRWSVSLGFENQDKSGDDVFGGNQGFSGTALVPEELDSEHQQVRARLDYADRCLQNGLELYLSNFENGNDAIVTPRAKMYQYLSEIKRLYGELGSPSGRFAVWPNNALIYALLDSPNPFPLDWMQTAEFAGNEERLLRETEQALRTAGIFVLVEKNNVKWISTGAIPLDKASVDYPYLVLLDRYAVDAGIESPWFFVYRTK